MQSKRWKLRLACGLILLPLAGCFSRYPYGPYGPGAYPGIYNTPPAGATVPNGATILPPTTLTPPGGQAPEWRQSQDVISPRLDAPTFNPNGANTVPEYNDPGGLDGGQNDLKLNESDAPTPFGYKQGPQRDANQNASPEKMTSHSSGEQADSFVDPVPSKPASSTPTLAKSDQAAGGRRPNPFDHDREKYRWLRGVVDYDEADKTWNIIYDMKPGQADRFGGSITLIGDARLNVLRAGDVVLVEGRVDSNARDRLGKPQYRVDHLARLVPKKHLAQSSQ